MNVCWFWPSIEKEYSCGGSRQMCHHRFFFPMDMELQRMNRGHQGMELRISAPLKRWVLSPQQNSFLSFGTKSALMELATDTRLRGLVAEWPHHTIRKCLLMLENPKLAARWAMCFAQVWFLPCLSSSLHLLPLALGLVGFHIIL